VPRSQRFRFEIAQWQFCTAILLLFLLWRLHNLLMGPLAQAACVVTGKAVRSHLGSFRHVGVGETPKSLSINNGSGWCWLPDERGLIV
jgi:hypothetical protein